MVGGVGGGRAKGGTHHLINVGIPKLFLSRHPTMSNLKIIPDTASHVNFLHSRQ